MGIGINISEAVAVLEGTVTNFCKCRGQGDRLQLTTFIKSQIVDGSHTLSNFNVSYGTILESISSDGCH